MDDTKFQLWTRCDRDRSMASIYKRLTWLACEEDLITAQVVPLSHVVFTNVSRQIQVRLLIRPVSPSCSANHASSRPPPATSLPCQQAFLMNRIPTSSTSDHLIPSSQLVKTNWTTSPIFNLNS